MPRSNLRKVRNGSCRSQRMWVEGTVRTSRSRRDLGGNKSGPEVCVWSCPCRPGSTEPLCNTVSLQCMQDGVNVVCIGSSRPVPSSHCLPALEFRFLQSWALLNKLLVSDLYACHLQGAASQCFRLLVVAL